MNYTGLQAPAGTAQAVGIIPAAVESHLNSARNINARLIEMMNRLRPPQPTPVGTPEGGSNGRPALVYTTESVSKELAEMSDLLAEIERFV